MKYRKKPVVIDAVQLSKVNWESVVDFLGESFAGNLCSYADEGGEIFDGMHIYTLEGTVRASIGDYIIRGIAGEHYPCKPEIFEATYEEIEA